MKTTFMSMINSILRVVVASEDGGTGMMNRTLAVSAMFIVREQMWQNVNFYLILALDI